MVKTKGQAKLEGDNCTFEYLEVDSILQYAVNEYTTKYVNMKTRKKNFSKNIEVFVNDLETYRKSCETELNKMFGKNRKYMMIKNTSHYLKRYNGKSLTTGMMDLANYTVFRKFDETHRKALFTGTYDEVVCYIRNIS